jgi:hypothetical protein
LLTNEYVGQSKVAAKAAVQEALQLHEALDVLDVKVADLEAIMVSNLSQRYQTATVHDDLIKTRRTRDETRTKLAAKTKALGTSDRKELKHLMNNVYLNKCLNVRALKERLRQKLISRKFELTRLERSFRKQRTGMCFST